MMPSPTGEPEPNTGVLAAFVCYVCWGFFPLYFLLTAPATPFEVVAERVIFTLIFCAALVPLTRQTKPLLVALNNKRVMLQLALAGALVFANWLIFIIASTTGHVLESSLGYYINPIISVALGLVFLGERLRPLQWAGIAVAAVSVLVMCIFYGSVPWLGLGLALTFGFYGLMKKRVGVLPAVVSLTLETLLVLPLALLILGLGAGQNTLFTEGAAHFWVIAGTGLITAVPLLLFATAASSVPLSVIGMIQYVGPTLQFLVAVFILHEAMPLARWVGFGLIWVAAAFFIADSLVNLRLQRRLLCASAKS
ncbi:MAG: EamA family transporter RarD [Rothia sp. (in: high G+C Gram-positive bacteria)]|nr:EamA family transporter RarD [Rothia sp. (in: high G+C Gram-positive bacteria)]